ncbi:MAG: hypothetical protein RL722_725 [Pseudomonadota bacterium]
MRLRAHFVFVPSNILSLHKRMSRHAPPPSRRRFDGIPGSLPEEVPGLPLGDAHLREQPLRSERVWQGRLLDVWRDEVSLPDGSSAGREYIVHPGAVMVVPLLPQGGLIMERQYRYPLARTVIEFPAGKLDLGEDPFDCARRELFEETGYRARRWALLGELHNAIAYATERIEVWVADDLEAGERRLDAGEFLDVFSTTQRQLEDWVASGLITDAKTLVGLLWLQQWQAGRRVLHWRDDPACAATAPGTPAAHGPVAAPGKGGPG